MPYATDADLTRRVKETKCLDLADRQTALTDAEARINVSAYGCSAVQAHVLYAAHLLACRFPAELGGEQGQVESLSAGEISSSFATQEPSEGRPNTTKYGRQFEAICMGVLAPYQVG